MQISSQSLICTPMTTAPATARTTNPRLTDSTSTTTTCLRTNEYSRFRAT